MKLTLKDKDFLERLRPLVKSKDLSIEECPIFMKRAGVKNMPSTKIKFNCNKIARLEGLDELAQLLFPGNRSHQRVLLAIFIELKYSPSQFLPHLSSLCDRYGFSPRMLETVRSKLRRLGIIDQVSRFNKSHGYREGWVFSNRFFHTFRTPYFCEVKMAPSLLRWPRFP